MSGMTWSSVMIGGLVWRGYSASDQVHRLPLVRGPSTSVRHRSWPSRQFSRWSVSSSIPSGWFIPSRRRHTCRLPGKFHFKVIISLICKIFEQLRDRRVLICSGMDNFSYLIGLLYPCVLVGCCTVYAFQTRKCPGGFNEARYIAFTTYTTCVLWLSFVPLYLTATSPTVRIVTLAMSLSIRCALFPSISIKVTIEISQKLQLTN